MPSSLRSWISARIWQWWGGLEWEESGGGFLLAGPLQQQQNFAPAPRACLPPLLCPLPQSTPPQGPETQQAGLPVEARALAALPGPQPLHVLLLWPLQHLLFSLVGFSTVAETSPHTASPPVP